MVFAVFLLIASIVATLILSVGYDDPWYIPMFVAIAALTYLVTVTSKAQDCEDFGYFSSMNNVYECTLEKTKLGKNGN
ncbi:hypothetical protein [[Haemophilus] ducreyi]|nr:hypothetical protein [[Haemophilus] ducreyi]AKO45048.1 hypothetical protein RZ66_01825 [[Haemophilus] ducreyi]AKO46450.1 hypothetical protein RZ67_01800 [[Haemophilus] ducreyi]AKO47792.1 hypothetical protein RZ68_01800 [[Haemophilus] ducreyi]ANF61628.1 hypothetical protein A6037_02150 [[Haemophilus] ducreyi]ANF67877.1 hypothetical protein A6041_04700 [[Haemophilus] ducreyi]